MSTPTQTMKRWGPELPAQPLLDLIERKLAAWDEANTTERINNHLTSGGQGKGWRKNEGHADEAIGMAHRSLYRVKKRGTVRMYQADEVCCRLGTHIGLIYPEYWTMDLGETDNEGEEKDELGLSAREGSEGGDPHPHGGDPKDDLSMHSVHQLLIIMNECDMVMPLVGLKVLGDIARLRELALNTALAKSAPEDDEPF